MTNEFDFLKTLTKDQIAAWKERFNVEAEMMNETHKILREVLRDQKTKLIEELSQNNQFGIELGSRYPEERLRKTHLYHLLIGSTPKSIEELEFEDVDEEPTIRTFLKDRLSHAMSLKQNPR